VGLFRFERRKMQGRKGARKKVVFLRLRIDGGIMIRRLIGLTTIFFLLLTGYAFSTKIKSAWKAPDATPESFQYKKALVAAIIKDKFIRKVAEDKAVKMIKTNGKDAVPSYLVFGETEVKDKDQAKTLIEGQGFDAAIVMKYVSSTDDIKYEDEEDDEIFYPYNQFWGYYSYGWGAVYNATADIDDLRVLIETRFYSLKDDKLIWAGVSETKDPKNPAKIVGEIAEETTKYLQKQGLMPKKKN
jgi:hypothetical protein